MSLVHRARRTLRRPDPAFAAEPALEPVYRSLFLRELAKLGLADGFFPVGGAANHSLLYLILRIGVQLRPSAVLDIGAGQSSLLWSMLQRLGHVGSVTTLEHDRAWAEAIGVEVDHSIVVTPLAHQLVFGRGHMSYDWAQLEGPFDVIVCDGPNGIPRHSRGGVLSLVDERLPDDFVIVLDDAERVGEQDTIDMLHRGLQKLGRTYGVGVVRSAKTQAVFAGGRYRAATYL